MRLRVSVMIKWVCIAVGGAVGSVIRFALQSWLQRLAGGTFPLGTLCVNVLGCLAMGALMGVFVHTTHVRPEYRTGLTVGLLGGFTTFSALGWESFALAADGTTRLATLYVAASCVFGLAAVWLGFRLAERWIGM